MKKEKTLHLEGAPIEVRGKAAERFWRLIKNPVKASPEEKEKIFNAPKELNLVRCDLW
jgi:hypothetical protein